MARRRPISWRSCACALGSSAPDLGTGSVRKGESRRPSSSASTAAPSGGSAQPRPHTQSGRGCSVVLPHVQGPARKSSRPEPKSSPVGLPRKPLCDLRRTEGSNPSPSAFRAGLSGCDVVHAKRDRPGRSTLVAERALLEQRADVERRAVAPGRRRQPVAHRLGALVSASTSGSLCAASAWSCSWAGAAPSPPARRMRASRARTRRASRRGAGDFSDGELLGGHVHVLDFKAG